VVYTKATLGGTHHPTTTGPHNPAIDILEINGLREITPDVVDAARQSLVIGTA
jgi:hypothetical protein